jgi:hypothetical protein
MEKEKKIQAGQIVHTVPLPLKVMAIADGYVMARYGACTPFAETLAAFEKRVLIARKN